MFIIIHISSDATQYKGTESKWIKPALCFSYILSNSLNAVM